MEYKYLWTRYIIGNLKKNNYYTYFS